MSDYRVWSVRTVDGLDRTEIPVSSFTWERKMCAASSLSAEILLTPQMLEEWSIVDLRTLTAHWKRTLVLEYKDEVVAAGIITNRPQKDAKINVQMIDLWGIFERRLAVDATAANVEKWKTTISSASLSLLAKRAVQRGTTGSTVPPNALPITLPADAAGSLTRSYYGYHLETVADVLDDLMAEGLDIDFQPRWVSGGLNWLMRVGAPLTGAGLELSVTGDSPDVLSFGESSDGSRMSNHVVIVGEGSEEDMLVRSNRDLTTDLPLLTLVDERKNATTAFQADALASRGLVDYRFQTTEYTYELAVASWLGAVKPGDAVSLWFDGHPWNADGKHERRVVRLSGGMSERFTVVCQPTGGA